MKFWMADETLVPEKQKQWYNSETQDRPIVMFLSPQKNGRNGKTCFLGGSVFVVMLDTEEGKELEQDEKWG